MDPWKTLAVHLPAEQDFVGFDFAPRHTDHVVHGFVVLEVRVCTIKLKMLRAVFKTSAGLDQFLQADTDVFRIANRTFGPGSLRSFITLALRNRG